MRIVQLGAGAHEEIVRLRSIKHHVDSSRRRASNRSRRQTGIDIGVIRRINGKMAIKDPFEFEIPYRILDGRARLQQHSFMEAVEIQTGNYWHLILIMALPLHNRGNYSNLDRSQSDRISFSSPRLIPKDVIFLLHAVEKLLGGNIPIHLVCSRNKKTAAGLFIQPILAQESVILQILKQRETVHHQMSCHFAGQIFPCAYEIIPSNTHRCLIAVFEPLNEFTVAYLCREDIVSRFRMIKDEKTHMQVQIGLGTNLVVGAQKFQHRVGSSPRIDIITMRLSIQCLEVTYMPAIVLLCDKSASQQGKNTDDNQDCTKYITFLQHLISLLLTV